ncbi:hypothetical protein [Corynebacterium terpenotabidum]|nr:hypothetical protein [Corynebacterium terpenotabidum]
MLPRSRRELTSSGVTRATIRDAYSRIERGVFVHNDGLLTETTSSGFARLRRIPAATLVRAHLLLHPGHISTGFGAASLSGMRYFVDEEVLEFLVSRGAGCANSADHLLLTRTRALQAIREKSLTPDPTFTDHLCTAPGLTLARMLAILDVPDAARAARWPVPDLREVNPAFTRQFIRQVQVSDAFHQCRCALAPCAPELLTGPPVLRSRILPDRARTVLSATNVGAESPPETLLRLVLADLAPGLRTQIPVFRSNGKLLTSADMGWSDQAVYIFYDGEHHQLSEQRDHDSEVLAELQRNGGQVFRVTAGQLKTVAEVNKLREMVGDALGL